MLTRQDIDEYTKSQPRGEGFDDNDTSGRYICYNCVFMIGCEGNELVWCNNDSCRNHDKFVERKYKK